MARKQVKIKTISYVRVGEDLIEVSRLSDEQKKELASWLKCTYLNHLFAGQAVFRPAE